MKVLNRFAFAAMLLVGLQSASADPLTSSLSFWGITDDDDGDTSNSLMNIAAGQSQLRVEVSSASLSSPYADFKFYHAGSTPMTIAEVYFDDGTLLGISELTGSGPGVRFTAGSASPEDLPGGNSIDPRFDVTAGFLADADSRAPFYGVNPGEWLNVRFNLKGGGTYQEVLDELGDGRLRVGMHVIAFDDDGSESFVNNPLPVVPVPAAVWGGLALLGSIGAARFRAGRRAMA